MEDEEIEVGDHVTVGNGKVHWVVDWIGPHGTIATLRSGMTGRKWYNVFFPSLHLHSKGKKL